MELHVIVVGAGPAGLAAALTLGRMRRRALVVDTGEPRNRYTSHLHNFPSRDGATPTELRRLMRKDVKRYPTVAFREDRAVEARLVEDGVELTFERGERAVGRRLVLAGGVRDTLPPIDGLAELFGSSVFTCPYCDGYEAAGRPLGAICTKAGQLVHWGGVLRLLSDDATVFANGVAVADHERAAANTLGASVVETPVARLRAAGEEVGVVLVGGREERRARLLVPTEVQPSNRLAEQLGCAMSEAGFIEVDELGRTIVPRVYAAGDAASPLHQAILAAASGTRAALAANHDALEAFELG
jgi:thioredoxin reductase